MKKVITFPENATQLEKDKINVDRSLWYQIELLRKLSKFLKSNDCYSDDVNEIKQIRDKMAKALCDSAVIELLEYQGYN